MRLAAVWACVRVRSEDIGKLPCILYPASDGEAARDGHPLYSLIRDRPNPRMTAFEFRQLMQTSWICAATPGAEGIQRSRPGRGAVAGMLDPQSRCSARQISKELYYRCEGRKGRRHRYVSAEGVLHLRGMSLDGMVTGFRRSPITARRSGLRSRRRSTARRSSATMRSRGRHQGADGSFAGSRGAASRSSWEAKHRGVENSNKIAIFDGGMEYVQTGMDNTDAQYIETRGMQNAEIWRIYPDAAAQGRRSQQGDVLEHRTAVAGIRHRLPDVGTGALGTDAEARSLLDSEQDEYFFEFLVDALLRGDFKSRMDGYAIARNWGIFSADDCRDRENMNHLPDGKGEIYLQPLNMVEAGTPPQPTTPAAAKALIAMLAPIAARQENTDA
jgi:HK97 family phage portal protein